MVKLPTPPLLMAALGVYHLLRANGNGLGNRLDFSVAWVCCCLPSPSDLYTSISGYQWASSRPTFARSGSFFNLRD